MEQCRICISTCNSEFVSLLDENSEDGLSCYGKAVLAFADVSISPEDKLPKAICHKCVQLLKYAIHFKLTCEKNYKTLQELGKRSSTYIPSTNFVDTRLINNLVDKTDAIVDESDKKCYKNVRKRSLDSDIDDVDTKVDKSNKIYIRNEIKDYENWNIDEVDMNDSETNVDDTDTKSDDDIINDPGSCSDDNDILDILDAYYNSENKVSDNKNLAKPHRRKPDKITKRHRETESELDDLLKIMEDNLEAVMKEDKRPIKSNPNKSTDTLTCKVCQKVLSSSSSLQMHMRRHGADYQSICEHCGRGFATVYELRYHLFYTHKEGKYIQCEQCDFKTIKPFDMKEHRRIHSGERPFSCEKCALTFRRRYIWKMHMENCHMEKKIKCPECPREFSRRGYLLEHTNSIHRRLYLYGCPQCTLTYAKVHTVRRHLADKHGVSRERQGRVRRINLSAPTQE